MATHLLGRVRPCLSRPLFSLLPRLARPCTATLVGKEMRAVNPEYYERLPPYDYVRRPYRGYHEPFDGTMKRFNSNSKIILVEGPIGVGKTSLAKQVAEEFDMLYMPELDHMMALSKPQIDYDFTMMNDEIKKVMPWAAVTQVRDFYENPHDGKATSLQFGMLLLRFEQYCDALFHLFSTGQGVVLDRSVFSDHVFMDAMFKGGFVSELAWSRYWMFKDDTLPDLLNPHLVIYLDIGVDTVKERIKQRARPEELNTSVLSDKYLREMERSYKETFLKERRKESHVLIYDWTKFGDLEMMIEDLETIDFDSVEGRKKFPEWDYSDDRVFCDYRRLYDIRNREVLRHLFSKIPTYDIPELVCPDVAIYNAMVEDVLKPKWKEFAANNPKLTAYHGLFSSYYPPHYRKLYSSHNCGAVNNCLER